MVREIFFILRREPKLYQRLKASRYVLYTNWVGLRQKSMRRTRCGLPGCTEDSIAVTVPRSFSGAEVGKKFFTLLPMLVPCSSSERSRLEFIQERLGMYQVEAAWQRDSLVSHRKQKRGFKTKMRLTALFNDVQTCMLPLLTCMLPRLSVSS